MNNVSRQPFDDGEEEGGRRESEKETETETEREREREKREKRKEDTTRRKPVINNVCMCVRVYIYVCVHGKKSERYVLYERDTAKATKKVGRWSVS